MHLLIVEDNPKMRRIMKSIVADFAEKIDECDDGDQAVALFSENRHDLILMDIHLKETNGIEAAKQITQISHKAKVIIVTNYDDAHFRNSAREAGAFDYILKENLLDVQKILQKMQ